MAANTVFKKTYLAFWSAVLVSGVGLSGCWNNQSPQDLLKEAQNYHAKGDDPAAIIQLKNALQKDANYGDARYLLGSLYKETGNLAAAEDEFHRALLSGFNKEKVQGDLGQVYLGRGEFQKIIDEIKPDGASKPEVQAGILVLRGDAFIGLGNREDAASSFAEAQKVDPAYLGAILGQARLLVAEGKPDGALSMVEQVITKDPRNVDGWIMKGDLYRATDKIDAAAGAYKQVATIDSKNPQAHASLAALYVTSGQMDLAQSEVATFEKLYPNSLMGKYLQALLDFRAQKFTAARDDVAQVLKVAPDHMPSILLRGVTAYQLGSTETAQKDLGRFVEAFPQNAYSRKMLALVDLKQKQPVEALKVLAPLLDAHPDPQVVSLAAEAYSLTGEYNKAAQMLEKQAAKDPANVGLRTQLGLTRLASGQTGRAIADLESAAKLDPAHMEAEAALAMTYLGKKDYDQALLYAQRMVKKDPKNPAYRNLVGAAYVGKNDLV
uniref:XrtA/PEP-CTERM system TPR-repeat protein PrsT n=1 Tax=Ferrovum sp. TaxID=2609467 RepID=UPI00262E5CA6